MRISNKLIEPVSKTNKNASENVTKAMLETFRREQKRTGDFKQVIKACD